MKRNPPDLFLFTIVLALLVLGLIMVTSASAPESLTRTDGVSVFHYGLRQLIFACLGLALMLFMINFPYQYLKKFTIPITVISLILLIVVLLFEAKKGSQRWINIGTFFQIQPSEFAKLAVIMFNAHYLTEIKKGVNNFIVGVMIPLACVSIVCLLVIKEPDFGTTIVIFATFMLMLFAGGVRMGHLSFLGAIGLSAGAFMAVSEEYRLARLIAFLNPWNDPRGDGWQIIQSLYALGSGGPFGLGLGLSRQKFHYLPEAHTDYIFSVLGEELGLLGTVTVLILFFLLAWRGFKIAISCQDSYGRMLATGITSCLVFQALLNIGVVTSTIPVTGITLPFLSYGGSSLLVSLFSIGILLNISKDSG